MVRRLATAVVVLATLACGGAPVAPAPSGPDVPMFGTSSSLANTRWRYEAIEIGKAYEMDFLPDGTILSHDRARGGKDTWQSDGKRVVISINDGFVVAEGEMSDTLTMGGIARNRDGETWHWRATRVYH